MKNSKPIIALLGLIIICLSLHTIAQTPGHLLVRSGDSLLLVDNSNTIREVKNSRKKQPYPDKIVHLDKTFEVFPYKHLVSEGYISSIPIQSPHSGEWLVTERNTLANTFNLFLITESKEKVVLLSNVNFETGYGVVPINWSDDPDIVYLEGGYFESTSENEAIYAFNLKTKEYRELDIRGTRTSTPLLSKNRTFFYYMVMPTGATDRLHTTKRDLYKYNISDDEESFVFHFENGASMLGWVDTLTEFDLLLNSIPYSYKTNEQKQLSFLLPFPQNQTSCVTRDGFTPPTGQSGSSVYCNGLGYHDDKIATDFDIPNGVYDEVLAVADGVVSKIAFDPTGYGNYIVITHSDNTQTLYAHLDHIFVNEYDNVRQGCLLGDGGNTGGSNGDHIHFEFRTSINMREYAYFSECGCIPHAGYQYTSQNFRVDCNQTSQPNQAPSVLEGCFLPENLQATGITPYSATISWQNYEGVCHCKLQFRKLGAMLWKNRKVYDNYYQLNNLSSNTKYEYRIRTNCDGLERSDYSNTYNFTTGNRDYCTPPTNVFQFAIGNQAYIDWNSNYSKYWVIYYKRSTSANYSFMDVVNKPILVSIPSGTSYDIVISSICGDGSNLYSDKFTFTVPYFKTEMPDSILLSKGDTVDFEEENAIGLNTIVAYPNPTSGSVSFLSNVPVVKVKLITLQGKIVQKDDVDSKSSIFLSNELSNGIYILQTVDIQGNHYNSRIILQR